MTQLEKTVVFEMLTRKHLGVVWRSAQRMSGTRDSALTKTTDQAMSRLAPNIRVVVSLSLIGGSSYVQISELLDIPVGTVRSRLSRGRRQRQ